MAQFYSENISIDRICVLNCQLVAYPNKLMFGKCLVSNNFDTVLPSDSSFTIYNVELECFLSLLIKFGASPKNDVEELFNFQEPGCKVTITSDEDINLLHFVTPNEHTYCFENNNDFKIFVSAVIDLALLTYCYSGIVNYNLTKFLNLSELCDYSDLSDEKVFELLNIIKPKLDYYMFLCIVQRHKNTLYLLKQLQASLQSVDLETSELSNITSAEPITSDQPSVQLPQCEPVTSDQPMKQPS